MGPVAEGDGENAAVGEGEDRELIGCTNESGGGQSRARGTEAESGTGGPEEAEEEVAEGRRWWPCRRKTCRWISGGYRGSPARFRRLIRVFQ